MIIRVFTPHALSCSLAARIIEHWVFAFIAGIAGITAGRPDIVIYSIPPFEGAFAAMAVAHIHRAKFVLELRDLWPDEWIRMGLVTSPILIKLLRLGERLLYRKAHYIIPNSEGYVPYLVPHYVKEESVRVIHSGSDIHLFPPAPARDDRQGVVVCLYLGTQGLQNNLMPLIHALESARSQFPGIRCMFVGDGCERQSLMRYCRKKKLDYITFIPPVSREKAIDYIREADICLLHTRKMSVNERHIPAKLYDYFAVGRPVVAGIRGQGEKIITEAETGICTDPEDIEALQKAICALAANSALRAQFGRNARSYAVRCLARMDMVKEYMDILIGLGAQ